MKKLILTSIILLSMSIQALAANTVEERWIMAMLDREAAVLGLNTQDRIFYVGLMVPIIKESFDVLQKRRLNEFSQMEIIERFGSVLATELVCYAVQVAIDLATKKQDLSK